MPAAAENAGIEPVRRAFAVLEALNARPVASVDFLARETALPKPTVVRLLDTLIAGGYARRLPRRGGYCLAERVVRLSGGFRHTDAVVEAARPFLSALTAEHKWPIALATLDRDAMLVRASTMRESPFATDKDTVNRRVPMLLSALGRAYISFCPPDERETILALLRQSQRAANKPARDPRYVATLVRSVRRRGYASAGPVAGDFAKGLAIPIQSGERILAAMTLRYLTPAMSEAEAVARYLPSMRQAAERVASVVEAGT
jgi:IclR family mhp operon transcriptional activator